jgi:hypothetical protein
MAGGAADFEQTAHHCSFCVKAQHDVAMLVAGPAGFICDVCVGHCAALVAGRAGTAQAALDWPAEAPGDDLLGLLQSQEAIAARARAQAQATIALLRQRAVSWEKIGKALGCSRQAAWERFG